MPSGATPKMMLSRKLVDLLKNCFVTCSPKRMMIGVMSVAKLLVNLFYGWVPGSAAASGAKQRNAKMKGIIMQLELPESAG
jgi:hypothetical protein